MITTTFTQQYPDQPWAPAVADNNTVTVTWTGTRYFIFSVETATGEVYAIEDQDDKRERLDTEINSHVHDGHTFHVLDAVAHPQVAAFINGDDTIPAKDASGGIPDYVFNTPNDDDDYVYEYNTMSFMQQLYGGGTRLTYDTDNNTFTMPDYLTHPLQNTHIFDGYEEAAAQIDVAVVRDRSEFTAAEITLLEAHSIWLKGVRARYASIEPWKIPCPLLGISYNAE